MTADEVRKIRLDAIRALIWRNGCDCACDHHYEEHDEDCTRCLACRINDILTRLNPKSEE